MLQIILAIRMVRLASKLPSRTLSDSGGIPAGSCTDRKGSSDATPSRRRARLKVEQGGAKCTQPTRPALIILRSSLYSLLHVRSKLFAARMSKSCNAGMPNLCIALVRPPFPEKTSRNINSAVDWRSLVTLSKLLISSKSSETSAGAAAAAGWAGSVFWDAHLAP